MRHRRVKKKEEKPVQRCATWLFAALEDCCSMREISGALGSSAQKFLPKAITEKNLSIGSHWSRLAPWVLNFPALLGFPRVSTESAKKRCCRSQHGFPRSRVKLKGI